MEDPRKRANRIEVRLSPERALVVDMFRDETYLGQRTVTGKTMNVLVADLKRTGWAIRETKNGISGLRGDPVRIDFIWKGGTWYQVIEYPPGWTARTVPMRTYHLYIDNLENVAHDYESKGWTAVSWDWHYRKGLRVFKGDQAYPVRASWQIKELRNQLERLVGLSQKDRFELKRLNLAVVL